LIDYDATAGVHKRYKLGSIPRSWAAYTVGGWFPPAEQRGDYSKNPQRLQPRKGREYSGVIHC